MASVTTVVNPGVVYGTPLSGPLTAGRVPYVTTGGLLTDSAWVYNNGSTFFGVGASAAPASEENAVRIVGPQVTSGNAGRGLNVEGHYAGTYASTGAQIAGYIEGANDQSHMYSTQSWAWGNGSGTVAKVAAYMGQGTINSGTWSEYYCFLASDPTIAGTGAITSKWAFFGNTTSPSYLAGKLVIGPDRIASTAVLPHMLYVNSPFTITSSSISLAQSGIYGNDAGAVGKGAALALGGVGYGGVPYANAFISGLRESASTYAGYFSIWTTSGGGAGGANSANFERVRVTSVGEMILYNGGVAVPTGKGYSVNSIQVVGAQGAAVANATDATTAISRLNDLLARLRAHGLIAT